MNPFKRLYIKIGNFLLRPFARQYDAQLQERLDIHFKNLQNQYETVLAHLHSVQTEVVNIRTHLDTNEIHLKEIALKLDHTELRLNGVEPRLDHTELRLNGVEPRLDHTELRLNGVEPRLDHTELRLNGVEPRLDHTELRLNGVEPRLDNMEIQRTELLDQLHNVKLGLQASLTNLSASWEKSVSIQAQKEKLLTKNLGAVSRQLMKTKWELIDFRDTLYPTPNQILSCKICGHSAPRCSFETKMTECIYNGGKLERYICPMCGVVFGATKFTELPQSDIDDDYSVNYMGFHEADSTVRELRAFYLLHPDKTKIYLNYGCGSWSSSLQQLHKDGFQVYGYEPYAPDTTNPYIISDKDVLMRMRFDGIFSNDLLEHLLDPIKEIAFMKSLLRTDDAKMSHSTCCYVYKYEYTRFHTHFFTGNSLDILCKETGLSLVERVSDEPEDDFICYVFASEKDTADFSQDLLSFMLYQGKAEKCGSRIFLHPDSILCGPCVPMCASSFLLLLKINLQSNDILECVITSDLGQKQIASYQLVNGENKLALTFLNPENDVEFVVKNMLQYDVVVEQVMLLPHQHK